MNPRVVWDMPGILRPPGAATGQQAGRAQNQETEIHVD